MDIVFKICRTCNESKSEIEFKPKRRVCKKCIAKENAIKYKDVIKQYYVDHQEEIIAKSIERHRKKMIEQGYKKRGRKRIINVDKKPDNENVNETIET